MESRQFRLEKLVEIISSNFTSDPSNLKCTIGINPFKKEQGKLLSIEGSIEEIIIIQSVLSFYVQADSSNRDSSRSWLNIGEVSELSLNEIRKNLPSLKTAYSQWKNKYKESHLKNLAIILKNIAGLDSIVEPVEINGNESCRLKLIGTTEELLLISNALSQYGIICKPDGSDKSVQVIEEDIDSALSIKIGQTFKSVYQKVIRVSDIKPELRTLDAFKDYVNERYMPEENKIQEWANKQKFTTQFKQGFAKKYPNVPASFLEQNESMGVMLIQFMEFVHKDAFKSIKEPVLDDECVYSISADGQYLEILLNNSDTLKKLNSEHFDKIRDTINQFTGYQFDAHIKRENGDDVICVKKEIVDFLMTPSKQKSLDFVEKNLLHLGRKNQRGIQEPAKNVSAFRPSYIYLPRIIVTPEKVDENNLPAILWQDKEMQKAFNRYLDNGIIILGKNDETFILKNNQYGTLKLIRLHGRELVNHLGQYRKPDAVSFDANLNTIDIIYQSIGYRPKQILSKGTLLKSPTYESSIPEINQPMTGIRKAWEKDFHFSTNALNEKNKLAAAAMNADIAGREQLIEKLIQDIDGLSKNALYNSSKEMREVGKLGKLIVVMLKDLQAKSQTSDLQMTDLYYPKLIDHTLLLYLDQIKSNKCQFYKVIINDAIVDVKRRLDAKALAHYKFDDSKELQEAKSKLPVLAARLEEAIEITLLSPLEKLEQAWDKQEVWNKKEIKVHEHRSPSFFPKVPEPKKIEIVFNEKDYTTVETVARPKPRRKIERKDNSLEEFRKYALNPVLHNNEHERAFLKVQFKKDFETVYYKFHGNVLKKEFFANDECMAWMFIKFMDFLDREELRCLSKKNEKLALDHNSKFTINEGGYLQILYYPKDSDEMLTNHDFETIVDVINQFTGYQYDAHIRQEQGLDYICVKKDIIQFMLDPGIKDKKKILDFTPAPASSAYKKKRYTDGVEVEPARNVERFLGGSWMHTCRFLITDETIHPNHLPSSLWDDIRLQNTLKDDLKKGMLIMGKDERVFALKYNGSRLEMNPLDYPDMDGNSAYLSKKIVEQELKKYLHFNHDQIKKQNQDQDGDVTWYPDYKDLQYKPFSMAIKNAGFDFDGVVAKGLGNDLGIPYESKCPEIAAATKKCATAWNQYFTFSERAANKKYQADTAIQVIIQGREQLMEFLLDEVKRRQATAGEQAKRSGLLMIIMLEELQKTTSIVSADGNIPLMTDRYYPGLLDRTLMLYLDEFKHHPAFSHYKHLVDDAIKAVKRQLTEKAAIDNFKFDQPDKMAKAKEMLPVLCGRLSNLIGLCTQPSPSSSSQKMFGSIEDQIRKYWDRKSLWDKNEIMTHTRNDMRPTMIEGTWGWEKINYMENSRDTYRDPRPSLSNMFI